MNAPFASQGKNVSFINFSLAKPIKNRSPTAGASLRICLALNHFHLFPFKWADEKHKQTNDDKTRQRSGRTKSKSAQCEECKKRIEISSFALLGRISGARVVHSSAGARVRSFDSLRYNFYFALRFRLIVILWEVMNVPDRTISVFIIRNFCCQTGEAKPLTWPVVLFLWINEKKIFFIYYALLFDLACSPSRSGAQRPLTAFLFISGSPPTTRFVING